jgi:UDP-N-acetylmuramoylalanine--D-glutamate ligase
VLVGGNIGYPVSAQVDASTADTVHVIEASSFQLEATDTYRPRIAALLNFSPDHLDRHPGEAAYAAAKQRIFANQRPDDWAVVNADSAEATTMATNVRARVVTYGIDNEAADVHVSNGFVWQRTSEGDIPLLPLAAVELHGRHMLSNVVAATAISHLAGATSESLARALAGFHGLEHVMEVVATRGGVRFVNDSKATNTAAARRALAAYAAPLRLVLGGSLKGERFDELARDVSDRAASVYLIGAAQDELAAALDRAGAGYTRSGALEPAVRAAAAAARPGDIVLLSPACASFDQYENFERRGEDFRRIVRTLEG